MHPHAHTFDRGACAALGPAPEMRAQTHTRRLDPPDRPDTYSHTHASDWAARGLRSHTHASDRAARRPMPASAPSTL